MIFLTSYSTRSMGRAAIVFASLSNGSSCALGQYCGNPAAPPATSMGTARPMPTKTSSSVGLMRAATMPMTRP